MNNKVKFILVLVVVLSLVTVILINDDDYVVVHSSNDCNCVIKYKEESNFVEVIYIDNVLAQTSYEYVDIDKLDETVGHMMTYCNNNH